MPSNQQILSDLRVVMETGHDLEIMNTYRGVPFICKAKILSIGGDEVRMAANDPSLICLTSETTTKVLGSDYFEPSQARVVSVDLSTGEFSLSNFTFLGARLGERVIVRVEPQNGTQVIIDCEGQNNEGELADISMSGMGVRLPFIQYNAALKPGTSVMVCLQLPELPFNLGGTILSASRSGDYYRLSIRFVVEHAHKIAIYRYLVDRRAEIEEELRTKYAQAIKAL